MQRIIVFLVVMGLVAGACGGGADDLPAGAGEEPGVVVLDLSGYEALPAEQAAAELDASLQEVFIAELAANGVTLSIEELASLTDDFVGAVAEGLLGADAEIAEITGGAGGEAAGPTTGVLLRAPVAAQNPEVDPSAIHSVSIITILFSPAMAGLQHKGPGDYGPNTVSLAGNPLFNAPGTLVLTKQGSKITVEFQATLGANPPSNVGIRIGLRVVIDACPDEAGETSVDFSTTTEYLVEVDGKTISGELRMNATGLVNVGDDAKISGFELDITGSRAARTATGGTIQPGASFVEISMESSSGTITNPTGRHSSEATVPDVEGLIAHMATTMDSIFTMTLGLMSRFWTEGQCIELKPEMPAKVGLGSQTPADVTVHHRYEEKTLELPITAKLTAGEVSIDPEEATGDPATFTYTAPSEANKTATITFEVRSKRGADRKTVEVTTESQAVDVAFSGTIDYSIQGITLHGVVTIPRVTLLEYGGDDPELKGTWTGTGPVEITLTSQIPGCGTATGTQQGGQVTVIATPHDKDGTLMLSLFAEDMEGGDATMSCGSGGATVAGMGISIGAGLINLGKVDIPAEPGTYPFESSGVAAGMVQYEVKGVAVVTESESFPG